MRNIQRLVFWCVVLLPWLMSLYLNYWVDKSDTWSPELPYRGLISVSVMGLGMVLSFLLLGLWRERLGK